MAETEIPADVREVAGTISLRVGHTSDGPSALCIAEGLWEAIMADRASRAPDPSREMLVEAPIAWLRDLQPDAEDEALAVCIKGDPGSFPVYASHGASNE